jgi:hypothetical protein
MRRILLLAIVTTLALSIPVAADNDDPAQTPSNNYYWEIITNHFEGSRSQQYQSILNANHYTLRGYLAKAGDPPALPGRHSEFDISGNEMGNSLM